MSEQNEKIEPPTNGSVWKSVGTPHNVREVLLIHEDQVVYWNERSLTANSQLLKSWHDNHTLISDPSQPHLPLPDGHKLVLEFERELHPVPEEAKRWYSDSVEWNIPLSYDRTWAKGGTNSAGIYAIPIDHEWEEDLQPKYKTFEIDWKSQPWPSFFNRPVCHGNYANGHRIIGYTDDPKYVSRIDPDSDKMPHYETQACDHTGNRVFAIGRLEGE